MAIYLDGLNETMVDIWGDALAVGALVVSFFVALFAWGQLKAQRETLAATVAQIELDEGKLGRLGGVVESLKGMVETQKAQVAALEKQLEVATRALRLQEETLAFEKARAERDAQLKQHEIALKSAELEWQKTGPFAKAKTWIDHGLEELERKVRRAIGR